jgi:esterase/lipase superfamily enzyme
MIPRRLRRKFPVLRLAVGAALAALTLMQAACVSDGLAPSDRPSRDFLALADASPGDPAPVQVFVASTRESGGDAEREGRAHYALVSIGVPPSHRIGIVERSSFGVNDAYRDFTVLSRRSAEEPDFLNEMAARVSGRSGAGRDVLIYVHGYHVGVDEARFRAAQIVTDTRFQGVPALFTWDSNGRGGLRAYESDKESATVARDALEAFLDQVAHVPGVRRVHILAHSMGAWLTMESLRAISIAGHPDLDGRLGEIMLAAPDIDLGVFGQQIARVGPEHVSVFVSSTDRALSLSSHLAGDRPRLGGLDPSNSGDLRELEALGVRVYDTSRLNSDFVGHNSFAEVPVVVRAIGALLARSAADEDSGRQDAAFPSPTEPGSGGNEAALSPSRRLE